MILSGEKKQEYREIKSYWNKRFFYIDEMWDTITFSNGYSKGRRQMVIELKGIKQGLGNVHWGAPFQSPVWILDLGKILTKNF